MEKIVYFSYPETANLMLEEIDYLFTDRQRRPTGASASTAVGEGDVEDVRMDGLGKVE